VLDIKPFPCKVSALPLSHMAYLVFPGFFEVFLFFFFFFKVLNFLKTIILHVCQAVHMPSVLWDQLLGHQYVSCFTFLTVLGVELTPLSLLVWLSST
jgi:hypothetical protein